MFNWLKKGTKKPAQNKVAILRDQKAAGLRTMAFLEDMKIQTRRAQDISPDYASAIRTICQQESSVKIALVLDLRRPDQEGQWLLIDLVLDNLKLMPEIAERFGLALKNFPDWQRTYMRLADSANVERMQNAEFYRRR